MNSIRVLAATVLLAGSSAGLVGPAIAAPTGQPMAAVAVPGVTMTEQVYWRGRGWGWGGAYVGGLAAGALIGGAIAGPYAYGWPGYYYGPNYRYYTEPAYAAPPEGDAEAYCMQRYRSYDPNSGTFLGRDGRRHPCP